MITKCMGWIQYLSSSVWRLDFNYDLCLVPTMSGAQDFPQIFFFLCQESQRRTRWWLIGGLQNILMALLQISTKPFANKTDENTNLWPSLNRALVSDNTYCLASNSPQPRHFLCNLCCGIRVSVHSSPFFSLFSPFPSWHFLVLQN